MKFLTQMMEGSQGVLEALADSEVLLPHKEEQFGSEVLAWEAVPVRPVISS